MITKDGDGVDSFLSSGGHEKQSYLKFILKVELTGLI